MSPSGFLSLCMADTESKRYIVVLAENKLGVLNRITSQLRKRNFNIESLTAGTTEKDGISRITLVFDGETTNTEQVVKQLDKLINITKVWDATSENLVIRETLLMKVKSTKTTREEILQFVQAFKAKVHAVYKTSLILEIAGSSQRIDDFIEIMKGFGIIEMVRTGATVLNQKE